MSRSTIPFNETGQFSGLVDDYLSGSSELRPFYRFSPDVKGFDEKLKLRKSVQVNRALLHERIMSQYSGISPIHGNVSKNTGLLKQENTFTVTTGHQLNILTGPLYFLYKIATVIRLAEELGKLHPECNFIPVYWMASEDHDYDEIKSVRIFGNNLTWVSGQTGAVGKFPTAGMDDVIKSAAEILGEAVPEVFVKSYASGANLSEATRLLVNELFGKYGLLVIDGDDKSLKESFIPEMSKEIVGMVSSASVEATNNEFSKKYKVQVTPRDINLFYMTDGIRERIVREQDGSFTVNNTELKFSETELLSELNSHPERFSPNVILRPVYQEKILPNLAYIGGPGELNYWLQLAGTFDAFGIQFPVLMLRNCFLLLNASARRKMDKLNVKQSDIFKSADYLTLQVLENSADIHTGTDQQAAVIQKTFDELAVHYRQLDPTLATTVDAERQKILNSLKNLEEKAKRLLKKKNETVVSQVKALKEQLMPGGNLQERTDNILSYCNGDPETFIDHIVRNTDPFEKNFILLELS